MASQLSTKPIVSVPERFVTEVTRDDILDGVACATTLCPLTRSIKRTLRQMGVKVAEVSVLPRDVEVYVNWNAPVLRYQSDAEEWVRQFDVGRHVEPRTVTLVRMP